MVFSSHLFLFYFLPLVLAVYFALPRRRRNLALLLASYLFYGWANPAFVLLMLFSTGVDYLCGLALTGGLPPWRSSGGGGGGGDRLRLDPAAPRSRHQKTAVAVSVVTNLSLLGFFKYFNFAVDSYNSLLAELGLAGGMVEGALRVTLPLGISFYTFQSMSYTIDVYRGRAAAQRNLVDFATYVAMFPQLVAGPILRFSEIEKQLTGRRETLAKAARGAAFFCLGMAKKVLLANPCGQIADLTFAAETVSPLLGWYGTAAYAFQIYFDFSGYSDMAIGLGLLLGFSIPKNFDSPYRAASITEFWRRWHISLSTWLKDYLYIPLGGNRKGRARTYVNLFLVMLLGGLWHGAAWTFVLWGAFHGALLAAERMRGKAPLVPWLPRPLRVAFTFWLVLLSWVLFRAPDLPVALGYLGDLFGLGALSAAAEAKSALVAAQAATPYLLGTFTLAAIVTWTAPQSWDWTRRLTPAKAAVALVLFGLAMVAMETQGYNPFIYFVF